VLAAVLVGGSIQLGYWDGFRFTAPWLQTIIGSVRNMFIAGGVILATLAGIHCLSRSWASQSMNTYIKRHHKDDAERLSRAFRKNSSIWRSIFDIKAAGWGCGTSNRIQNIISAADHYVQKLNDQYTHPSGDTTGKESDSAGRDRSYPVGGLSGDDDNVQELKAKLDRLSAEPETTGDKHET
jgi:hypothetical protein